MPFVPLLAKKENRENEGRIEQTQDERRKKRSDEIVLLQVEQEGVFKDRAIRKGEGDWARELIGDSEEDIKVVRKAVREKVLNRLRRKKRDDQEREKVEEELGKKVP